MTTRNKLLLGLSIFGVVSLFLGLGHKALAATIKAADWKSAIYTIVTDGEIDVTLTNGNKYVFKDQDPSSPPDNFKSVKFLAGVSSRGLPNS